MAARPAVQKSSCICRKLMTRDNYKKIPKAKMARKKQNTKEQIKKYHLSKIEKK